jgi:hypothetical protein
MVVRRSDWVVVGVDIGMNYYDDENWELYDEFSEQKKVGEITYLIDGLSGDYFIVGTVLRADTGGYSGFGLFEIDMEQSLEQEKEKVRLHIKKNFGLDVSPKLIVLTHWT